MKWINLSLLFVLSASALPNLYSFGKIVSVSTGDEGIDIAGISTQVMADKDVRLNKRNNPVTKALKAVIHYNCPSTGPTTLTVRWKVVFNFVTGHLEVLAVEGLDRFKPEDVTLYENNFAAYMRHHHCETVGHKNCSYHFRGQTLGTVFFHDWTIEMEIIKGGNVEDAKPLFTEYCEYTPRVVAVGNCSATPRSSSVAKCPISVINVYND